MKLVTHVYHENLPSLTMRLLGSASVDSIMRAFRHDSLVVQKLDELRVTWPDTPEKAFLRVKLVYKSGRSVDRMLGLVWNLYALDQAELLSNVRPVWPREGLPNHSWSLREMIAAIQGGDFTPQKWDKVQKCEAEMRAQPPRDIGSLIGYRMGPKYIDLEEGNTRVTAAALASVLPPIIKMYLGEPPIL